MPKIETHPRHEPPTFGEIEAANTAAGHHWFDRDKMADTRLGRVYSGPGGLYFTAAHLREHSNPNTPSWQVWKVDPETAAIDPVDPPAPHGSGHLFDFGGEHAAKYGAFCRAAMVRWDEGSPSFLGRTLEQLVAAYDQDEHLNTIPLHAWDRLAGSFFANSRARLASYGHRAMSLSDGVCIQKAAARELVLRTKAKAA